MCIRTGLYSYSITNLFVSFHSLFCLVNQKTNKQGSQTKIKTYIYGFSIEYVRDGRRDLRTTQGFGFGVFYGEKGSLGSAADSGGRDGYGFGKVRVRIRRWKWRWAMGKGMEKIRFLALV